jgi:HEAT repeat protein
LQIDDEDYRLGVALAAPKAGKEAVPGLVTAAKSSDPGMRYYAIWGLGRLGSEAPEALPVITTALKDDNIEVRRKAVWALSQVQPQPEAAIPLLVAALSDDDSDVREAAAEALARYGKSAVPALRKQLDAKELEQRHLAVRALGLVGPDAADAVPQLRAFLLDPNSGLQDGAAIALSQQGAKGIPPLVEALAVEYPPEWEQVMIGFGSVWSLAATLPSAPAQHHRAVSALGKAGSVAIDALLGALQAANADVRSQAAGALATLGFNDRRIVVALAELLRDPSGSVRAQVKDTLLVLTPEPRVVMNEVLRALKEPEADVRVDAVDYLGRLGTPALQPLLASLRDPEAEVRTAAVKSLQVVAVSDDLLIATLTRLLKDKDPELRKNVLGVLLRCPAGVAMPLFLKALKEDDDAVVRRQAAVGVRELSHGDKVARQALAEATKEDKDPFVRGVAVNALTSFGLPAVPVLIDALGDDDQDVRQTALDSLQKVQLDNKKMFPLVTAALKSEKVRLRLGATYAMNRFGKDAVDELLKMLKDPEVDIRFAAVYALDDIGEEAIKSFPAMAEIAVDDQAPEQTRRIALRGLLRMAGLGDFWPGTAGAVPFLIERLENPDKVHRWRAASTLAAIGPAAKDAIPALEKASKDPDKSVAGAAAFALERVQKKDGK